MLRMHRKIVAAAFFVVALLAVFAVAAQAQTEVELGAHGWVDGAFDAVAAGQKLYELDGPLDVVVKGTFHLESRDYGLYAGLRYDWGPAHFQGQVGAQYRHAPAPEPNTQEPVLMDPSADSDWEDGLHLAVQPKVTIKIPGSTYGLFGAVVWVPGHDEDFGYRFGLVLGL